MTQRTEQSAIERATTLVQRGLNDAISQAHKTVETGWTEAEFRRMLAGYFERQTEDEWREMLGVEGNHHT